MPSGSRPARQSKRRSCQAAGGKMRTSVRPHRRTVGYSPFQFTNMLKRLMHGNRTTCNRPVGRWRSARYQFAVSLALLMVGPLVVLWYPVFLRMTLSSGSMLLGIVVPATVLACFLAGYYVLGRYPASIDRTRQFLEEWTESELPETFPHVSARRDDTRTIEIAIRGILTQMKAQLEARETEARQLRSQIETANAAVTKAHELNASKNQFVETAAHELRTPMAPLNSAIEMLIDGDVGSLSEQQLELLAMMHRNVERLSRFASDMLLLSRLRSGKQPLQVTTVNLRSCLTPCVDLLRHNANKEGKTVQLDIENHHCAIANASALSQVVTNLVNNALIHAGDGTTVRIASTQQHEAIHLSVHDDGDGIPEDAIKKLFDHFFLVEAPSQPRCRVRGSGWPSAKNWWRVWTAGFR